MTKTERKKAIIRRRVFLGICGAILAIVVFLVGFIIKAAITPTEKGNNTSDISSSEVSSQENVKSDVTSGGTASEDNSESQPENSSVLSSSQPNNNTNKLDPSYSNLLLVNSKNPLPDTYDTEVRKYLVEIDKQYRNNDYVTQIHKDIYPYITAMVATAQADGVDLRVWSPFRSYAIQKDLFQKQVNRVGGDEEKAATVVARPGTSEHNTGLCADFNMASDAFEKTAMYQWMVENAEDFGFVMRYRKDKQPITGVIHESWHWRFVGINSAKEMNRLDMCLEEYVEYLQKQKENTGKKEN